MAKAFPTVKLPECTTIGELRQDLILVTDSQDVREMKRDLGGRARGYDAFLVKLGEGEIVEAWGFRGSTPFLSKLACRVK